MDVLVLKPGRRTLDYACMRSGQNCPVLSARLHDSHVQPSGSESLCAVLQRVREEIVAAETFPGPDAIAVRVLFGGPIFQGPAVATPEVLRRLESLIPRAPLHLPLVLSLVEGCRKVFPEMPVVLVFETAFFAQLPPREALYGLSAEFQKTAGIRRYGFNGLFHEAACRSVNRARQRKDLGTPARILSLCLEPQPEVAAVAGKRPLMVTSGVTPLEGIPGQTTSGEIDPTILLSLVQDLGWGPEQINALLTEQSGLQGLVGKPVTVDTVLRSHDEKHRLAREVLQYRFLLACGAGIAALSGLDALVFSGRYAAAGEVLGPWLLSRLSGVADVRAHKVSCDCFRESLDWAIADIAAAEVLPLLCRAYV